jgi:hypothetical protein
VLVIPFILSGSSILFEELDLLTCEFVKHTNSALQGQSLVKLTAELQPVLEKQKTYLWACTYSHDTLEVIMRKMMSDG